ncbi:MAG TPA: hypothetical protein VN493_01410 [Thermoanaerobaculia bacterium]|nr:hypothetical protein [Thermoanaerobaculia bacterium]
MDISKFQTNKSAEEEGIWVDVDGNGTKVKVARINNARYKKFFQKITKPYKRQIRNGTLAEELAEKLLVDALANTILLDWKGFTKGGEDFPYSVDNARSFLQESADFRDFVSDAANEMENFRAEELEEARGN